MDLENAVPPLAFSAEEAESIRERLRRRDASVFCPRCGTTKDRRERLVVNSIEKRRSPS